MAAGLAVRAWTHGLRRASSARHEDPGCSCRGFWLLLQGVLAATLQAEGRSRGRGQSRGADTPLHALGTACSPSCLQPSPLPPYSPLPSCSPSSLQPSPLLLPFLPTALSPSSLQPSPSCSPSSLQPLLPSSSPSAPSHFSLSLSLLRVLMPLFTHGVNQPPILSFIHSFFYLFITHRSTQPPL